MKTVLICPDGAADWPCPELDDRTPLQAARTPNMDALAAIGRTGLSQNVPKTKPPGSDVACMALLGYDPEIYHTGRAPLEAPSIGINMRNDQTAVRCNLVTITDDGVMDDFTAGHISTEEAAELMASLNDALQHAGGVTCHTGVSYRNLLLVDKLGYQAVCFAPHDIVGEEIDMRLPGGPGSDDFLQWMAISRDVFAHHPVNETRRAAGLKPATQIWLWGYGTRPAMPPFKDVYGASGAMISAVALLRSLAIYTGLDVITVPGATGYLDTDYAGKARYGIDALRQHDFLFIHVEAPDEMGHEGRAADKTRAIELIDEHIVGPVHDALRAYGEYRIMISPDHPTPCELKTHSREAVPFIIAGTGIEPDDATRLTEQQAAASGWVVDPGWRNIRTLLNG